MIQIQISFLNSDIVVERLYKLPDEIKKQVIPEGLRRITKATFKEAFAYVSGSGASPPGSYPVPVRTGNLRRLLDFILPGQSKSGHTAGLMESYVLNTAGYADKIHENRKYILDAVDDKRTERLMNVVLDEAVRAV